MGATDISNQEDDSDHDNLTEDKNLYEANAQETVYMVNEEKSEKTSTSKKRDGDKDTDKVVENPTKIVIDSKKKEEEETMEDGRKMVKGTKLFINLAQSYAFGKKNSK